MGPSMLFRSPSPTQVPVPASAGPVKVCLADDILNTDKDGLDTALIHRVSPQVRHERGFPVTEASRAGVSCKLPRIDLIFQDHFF